MGIAIPHCKSDAVTKAGLAAMVVKDGVDFESLDGTPAKIISLLLHQTQRIMCIFRCSASSLLC